MIMTLLLGALLFQACGGEEERVREPVPLPDPSPIAYPEGLWDLGVQGETEVLVHVNELGDVDSVLIAQSSGFSDFDTAAMNGAKRLRFTPGQRGDRRVAMWARIPIRFARDSTAVGGVAPRGDQE